MSFKLNAKTMGVSQMTQKCIDDIVKEQLNNIQIQIINAHKQENLSHIIYRLPYSLAIPALSLKKAQVHVYYEIVKQIKDNNFDVTIDIDNANSKTILEIRWTTMFDDSKEESKRKYLCNISKQHLIENENKKMDKYIKKKSDETVKYAKSESSLYVKPRKEKVYDEDHAYYDIDESILNLSDSD